jgi:5-methylcytosine-specific restriction endonuclease McrA
MELKPCGTVAAYNRHRRKNETPCQICFEAEREYARNRQALKPRNRTEYRKDYYQKNIDRVKLVNSRWKENNIVLTKDINRKSERKRRARKLGNGFEGYTELSVLEKYGEVCHICKKGIDLSLPRRVGVGAWEYGLHMEHVVPISAGGPDNIENVKPSHALCNLRKHY